MSAPTPPPPGAWSAPPPPGGPPGQPYAPYGAPEAPRKKRTLGIVVLVLGLLTLLGGLSIGLLAKAGASADADEAKDELAAAEAKQAATFDTLLEASAKERPTTTVGRTTTTRTATTRGATSSASGILRAAIPSDIDDCTAKAPESNPNILAIYECDVTISGKAASVRYQLHTSSSEAVGSYTTYLKSYGVTAGGDSCTQTSDCSYSLGGTRTGRVYRGVLKDTTAAVMWVHEGKQIFAGLFMPDGSPASLDAAAEFWKGAGPT